MIGETDKFALLVAAWTAVGEAIEALGQPLPFGARPRPLARYRQRPLLLAPTVVAQWVPAGQWGTPPRWLVGMVVMFARGDAEGSAEHLGVGYYRPDQIADRLARRIRTPRELLRALRRIETLAAYARARRAGLERAEAELHRQQARYVEALEAEAVVIGLRGQQ